MSTFYKIFFSVIAVFLVLLTVGAVFFSLLLGDYESSLPASVAEKYFDEQVKTFGFEGFEGTEFETAEQVALACKQKYSSKELSPLTAAANGEQTHTYIVKCGEERVLKFTVVPSGEKSKFGFDRYKIGKIDFLFGNEISLRAPADCTVYLNGKALDENHRGDEVDTEEMDLPSGISAIAVYTYTVRNIYSEPQLSAVGNDGEERNITFNEQAGNHEVALGYSDELKEQFGTLALNTAKAYSAYMQNDVRFAEVAKYFQHGTKTYENIRTSEVYWVWAHDSYAFSDEWCGEFKQLGDGVFTCRVKMVQTLYLTNNAPYKDYVDVTICFVKQANGNYLAYSLKGNG